MGKQEEWVTQCHGTTPVSRVSEIALTARLSIVDRYVADVIGNHAASTETVHQLRVAVRRTTAALSLFAETIPRSARRKWKRKLRRLRQSAGMTRDLDVMSSRLEFGSGEVPITSDVLTSHESKLLRRELRHLRAHGELTLLSGCKRWEKFLRKQAGNRLGDNIAWRGGGSQPQFRCSGAMKLRSAFRDFSESASVCHLLRQPHLTKKQAFRAEGLSQLHQLRIAVKKVRYVMELLEPAYGAKLRQDVCPVFTQFQDRLGEINDHVSASNFYRGLKGRIEKHDLCRALRKMVQKENEALEETVGEFRRWWSFERLRELDRSLHATLEHDAPTLRTSEGWQSNNF